MQQALEQLRRDPVLASIIDQVGEFSMGYRDPDFGSLVRSILSQQISSKVARVFIQRLVDRMPDGVITPEAILRMRLATFRKLGFSAAKTAYIRDLARLTKNRELIFELLPAMTDEEIVAHLTKVKGIGVWTAHMFLMFGLRRPDVLPTGDLAIRAAFKRLYNKRRDPSPEILIRHAKRWQPYRSVASWYLWRSLDTEL